jgi:chemotaxis protein CheY-P-specific phosphatase CheC
MAPEITQEQLESTVGKVLQDAAFVFTEPLEDDLPDEGEVVQATLEFTGSKDGRLVFSVPPTFAIELAANLLGIEADDPTATSQKNDAVGETLNIVAGILMESWLGADAQYNLSPPTTRTIPPADTEARSDEATCRTSLAADDEYRVDLAIFVS